MTEEEARGRICPVLPLDQGAPALCFASGCMAWRGSYCGLAGLDKEQPTAVCFHCGERFPVGSNADRRLDSKFCCDEHRILFNSLKRSRKP